MVSEELLTIRLGSAELLGLLSHPLQPSGLGVLIIVGGPQYRVGAHRHFVQLARELAAAGHAVLRFDHRGVGDSLTPPQAFHDLDDDIAAGIDALWEAQPGLRGVVLWGLCDAASAALLYQRRRNDARVKGLALLNPWVRSPQGEAQTRLRHYYLQRLKDPSFWQKLLRGGVGLAALRDWWQARRAAQSSAGVHQREGKSQAYQALMAEGWQRFNGALLLQLSGRDLTAREFEAAGDVFPSWRGWQAHPRLLLQRFDGADHTFSQREWQQRSTLGLLDWLREQLQ